MTAFTRVFCCWLSPWLSSGLLLGPGHHSGSRAALTGADCHLAGQRGNYRRAGPDILLEFRKLFQDVELLRASPPPGLLPMWPLLAHGPQVVLV